MSANEDVLVQTMKQQFGASLRLMEALVEGATKLREMQIKAATEAHADLEATRKALTSTSDPAKLLELQANWMRANAEKSAAYWNELFSIVTQTHGQLLGHLCAPLPVAAPAESTQEPVVKMIDQAYRQWLEATQQFYKLPAIPAEQGSDRRAA